MSHIKIILVLTRMENVLHLDVNASMCVCAQVLNGSGRFNSMFLWVLGGFSAGLGAFPKGFLGGFRGFWGFYREFLGVSRVSRGFGRFMGVSGMQ